ncbi:MAG: dTDP-glucose 4,6-dehydratase [Peptococcaceae bacterium]|nr:dTDP-glucose 4,6-dehydratase [Peptococcaceae bacterium]
MRTVLVTGGAGFIGSCFVRKLAGSGLYRIINLDLLTYAGNLDNLKSVEKHPNYHFVKGDIGDRLLLDRLFAEYEIDSVVNFAAESHVDRSIEDPASFIRTNVMGTQALLDTAIKNWKLCTDKSSRAYRPGVKFLQVSTDEVYGALGPTGLFTEESPPAPNSPYSASKAAADLLARAYAHTYGIPLNITRCSNNYGPYQFPEKLIPLMINNSLHNTPLPVYGDGLQIRDWLHVEDHCNAIAEVLERGRVGEIYNIGGNCERANLDIVKTILRILDKPESLISHVKDRPGHDRRYAIDNTKITTELEWRPAYTFDAGLRDTVEWYLDNTAWLERITSGEYMDYYGKTYG